MKKTFATLQLTVCVAGVAMAQVGTGFSIQDGYMNFSQGDSPIVPTSAGPPSYLWNNVPYNGFSVLESTWWWYRVEGEDSREWSFNNALGTTLSGNTATTEFAFAAFEASLRYTIHATSSDAGAIIQEMIVGNTTTSTITLNLFSYVFHGFTPQNSYSVSPTIMRVEDGWLDFHNTGYGASAWQASGFSGYLNLLRNQTADNLSNTGLPLLQGLYMGGFQWVLTLQPGQSGVVTTKYELVPEPSGVVAVVLGMALVCVRRRRRV